MNPTAKVFAILLGATLFFNVAMNFMGDNIEDFENRPLPPKRVKEVTSLYPTLKIDATSRDAWQLVDFSAGRTHPVENIEGHPEKLRGIEWDLGFQRTKVISNGGVTNAGGQAGVLNLGEVDFDSVHTVPAGGFTEDSKNWGNVSNTAIADWYLYRTRTHNVESKKNVYIVRTAEGGHLKMRILNYYCNRPETDCKTMMCTRDEAACLTVEYSYIPPGETRFPEPPAPPPVPAQAAALPVP